MPSRPPESGPGADLTREERLACLRLSRSENVGPITYRQLLARYSTATAALWAVLTRMHKPVVDRYEGDLRDLVANLTPLNKAELYGPGKLPDDVKGENAKVLKTGIPQIFKETWTLPKSSLLC